MNHKHFALGLLVLVMVVVSACAPAAAPTAVPTKAPEAAPTAAPAAPTAAPAAPTAVPVAKEKLGITLMVGSGITADGLTKAVEKYNAEQSDVAVTLDIQQDATNWQKTAATTIFNSPDHPDATWWWCARTFQYKDIIAAGLLEPLDDLYAREGWDSAFPKGTLDFYTEPDGHRYAVNEGVVWTPYVWYNKDIFKKVGVEVPKTWDEFYAVSKKLRDAGYEPLSTVYEMSVQSHLPDGLMLRSWTEEEYQAFLINWSPDAPEWSLKYKWTDPDGVRIFQTIKDMADKEVFVKGFAGITDYNAALSLFTTGKAAMYQDGSWAGGAGTLPKQATFDWGYFYYPPIQEKQYGPVGAWLPNCYMVFKGDPKKVAAAKELVAWLISKPIAKLTAGIQGNPPGRVDIPKEELTAILTASMAQEVEDVKNLGAPALYESAVPPECLDTLKQSVDQVLTAGLSPADAAAKMEACHEKFRKAKP